MIRAMRSLGKVGRDENANCEINRSVIDKLSIPFRLLRRGAGDGLPINNLR